MLMRTIFAVIGFVTVVAQLKRAPPMLGSKSTMRRSSISPNRIINITNTGANGIPVLGPGFSGAAGNICVNCQWQRRLVTNNAASLTTASVVGGLLAYGMTIPNGGLKGPGYAARNSLAGGPLQAPVHCRVRQPLREYSRQQQPFQ